MVEDALIFRGGFHPIMEFEECFPAHKVGPVSATAGSRAKFVRTRTFEQRDRLGRIIALQFIGSANKRNPDIVLHRVGRELPRQFRDQLLGTGCIADCC